MPKITTDDHAFHLCRMAKTRWSRRPVPFGRMQSKQPVQKLARPALDDRLVWRKLDNIYGGSSSRMLGCYQVCRHLSVCLLGTCSLSTHPAAWLINVSVLIHVEAKHPCPLAKTPSRSGSCKPDSYIFVTREIDAGANEATGYCSTLSGSVHLSEGGAMDQRMRDIGILNIGMLEFGNRICRFDTKPLYSSVTSRPFCNPLRQKACSK